MSTFHAVLLSTIVCTWGEVLGNESCTSEDCVDNEVEEIKASLVQLRPARYAADSVAEEFANSTLIPRAFAEVHPIEIGEDVSVLQTERPGTLVGQWVDLGAGCCQTHVKPRFDGYVTNANGCIAKAEKLFGGFILYGWQASTWCTVYPREYNCGRNAHRVAGAGDCNTPYGPRGGNTGVHTLQLFSFMNLGKGCCHPSQPLQKVVFNGNMVYNDGKPGDLRACLQMCEWQHFGECGYVLFGWSNAPQWCTVYAKDSECSSLDSGPHDCGSSGQTGVHTFHFLSNCGKCTVK